MFPSSSLLYWRLSDSKVLSGACKRKLLTRVSASYSSRVRRRNPHSDSWSNYLYSQAFKFHNTTWSDRTSAALSFASLYILCCYSWESGVAKLCNDKEQQTSFQAWMHEKKSLLQEFTKHPFLEQINKSLRWYSLSSKDASIKEDVASPIFETVSITLNHTINGAKYLPVNPAKPIPYESEIFDGKVLFLIRSSSMEQDPVHYQRFAQEHEGESQLQMELQIQGRFKRQPTGKIYMGIELADDTNVCFGKMSHFTKGIYAIILNLLERFISGGMHYSFGSDNERPHIVGPILNNLDACIVSKCSVYVPELGSDEIRDHRSARDCEWNDQDIYTFTFRSTVVDLVEWNVVKLPTWIAGKSGSLDLARLVGRDSKMRIVAYEYDGEDTGHKVHRKDATRYLFCAEVESLIIRSEKDVLHKLKLPRSALPLDSGVTV